MDNNKQSERNPALNPFEVMQMRASESNQADFQASYTDNIPTLLQALNITLALTSYQSQRLILLRSTADDINLDFTFFPRPMGLAVDKNSIVLGTFNQVIRFQREDVLVEKIKQPLVKMSEDATVKKLPSEQGDFIANTTVVGELGEAFELSAQEIAKLEQQRKVLNDFRDKQYQPADEKVDACFITRSSHYSGMINIHDVAWGDEGLWAVNSTFSCLCTLSPQSSFIPKWKPHFIDQLEPHDLCHLNGMAMENGKPAYVTTFSTHNEVNAWRESSETDTGTLMSVESNEILLSGLGMPHSPRCHNGKVYFCESSRGLVASYDPITKERVDIACLPGFTRGMAFFGSLLFVATSKKRSSSHKSGTELEKLEQTHAGIWVINLEDNSELGHVLFTGSVEQIYDISIIEGCCFPELLEPDHPRMRNHFCYPPL